MFQHLLREESIKTSLEAGSREAALTELVATLPSWGITNNQKIELLEKLIDPSRDCIAIGDDVVMAACVVSGMSFPLAAMGITRHGVSFRGEGKEPSHFIFLVVLPEHEDTLSQKSRFEQEVSVFAGDKFLKERLKLADSAEEAYEIVLREGRQDQILMQYSI